MIAPTVASRSVSAARANIRIVSRSASNISSWRNINYWLVIISKLRVVIIHITGLLLLILWVFMGRRWVSGGSGKYYANDVRILLVSHILASSTAPPAAATVHSCNGVSWQKYFVKETQLDVFKHFLCCRCNRSLRLRLSFWFVFILLADVSKVKKL